MHKNFYLLCPCRRAKMAANQKLYSDLTKPKRRNKMPDEKKASKKKASKKKAASKPNVERKSPLYQTTGKTFPEMTGQGSIVLASLQKLQPATAAQVAADCASKLETKQPPRTVVTYYFMVWKSENLVKNAKQPKEEKKAA